jgi:hypothetical protein
MKGRLGGLEQQAGDKIKRAEATRDTRDNSAATDGQAEYGGRRYVE